MTKRMLIDGAHPEQTRVVVMEGHRLLEFDTEIASQRTLKGNIYLAKVTRVEPSLQAAFVDYGGNRHGFLPFSEIHPDYYRIPVADREAIKASQRQRSVTEAEDYDDEPEMVDPPAMNGEAYEEDSSGSVGNGEAEPNGTTAALNATEADPSVSADGEEAASEQPAEAEGQQPRRGRSRRNSGGGNSRGSSRPRRSYTIQEVIKRGQIMLIQVVKEERGTKGAAVTSYLSLAGRYCVLMPNTARGGGISRKITNAKDRKRLKEIVDTLAIPESMAVIVRTAGIGRTKSEIKRDYDFLAKTWERIRDVTLQSRAPVLIYEESDLVKRTLRDSYTREIEEVLVQGDLAYREAKNFMKTLMPSHAKRVQPYKETSPPLFHRFNVDAQLHQLHSPIVQLPSGGYLVINLTEALVSIDINSGRSTRERHIEETALKTNLEASEEVARQLRLRDLAGLIVIDFIDMEDRRNNMAVERKLKDALRTDRARVQVGRISPLGLMEMSRQRLRPSLLETIMHVCPTCSGLGRVASTASSALQTLSMIEDEGLRGRASIIRVHVAGDIALYILNEKRDDLARIERDYSLRCMFEPDASLVPPDLRIDIVQTAAEAAAALEVQEQEAVLQLEAEEVEEPPAAAETVEEEEGEDGGRRRRGRRSGRRRRREEEQPAEEVAEAAPESESKPEADKESEESDRSRSKRRRRRRRPRGEGRAPLPGVATFLKSATPLAWHVAAESVEPLQKPHASRKDAAPSPQQEAKPEAIAQEPQQPVKARSTEAAPVEEPAQETDMPVTSAAEQEERPPAPAPETAERLPEPQPEPALPAESHLPAPPAEQPSAEPAHTEAATAEAAERPEPAEAAAVEEKAGGNGAAHEEQEDERTEQPEAPPPRPRRRGWWQRLLE